MKKIILALSAIALVVSCSQSRKWTDKERDEVRKVVRDRHDRSAIRHMEARIYTNLEECVVTTIEETYPDYNRFDKLTGKTDTVDAVIVDCLGFTIGPDYENLPLLFPYDQLQQAGVLPAGLSNDQVKSFYGSFLTWQRSRSCTVRPICSPSRCSTSPEFRPRWPMRCNSARRWSYRRPIKAKADAKAKTDANSAPAQNGK